METAVVKLCSPQLDVTEDAVLSRIGALERTVNRLMNMISSGTLTVQKDDNLNKNGETSNKAERSENTAEFNDTENSENTVSNQAEDPQNSSREPQRKRGAVDVDEIYRNAKPFPNWKEVVENLRKYSKTISAAFDGTKAYVSGRYILIDSPSDIPFQLLKQSSQREKIREAVLEITGATYSLGPYRPPEKKIREEKEDPIEKLTENFKSLGIEVTEE